MRSIVIAFLMLASIVVGQQQNSQFASLDTGIANLGPSIPCGATPSPYCLPVPPMEDLVSGLLTGPPLAQFEIWVAAGAPVIGAAILPGGSLDIDPSTAQLISVGVTGAGNGTIGQYGLSVGGFSALGIFSMTTQGLVYNPADPAGYRLTAATHLFR